MPDSWVPDEEMSAVVEADPPHESVNVSEPVILDPLSTPDKKADLPPFVVRVPVTSELD